MIVALRAVGAVLAAASAVQAAAAAFFFVGLRQETDSAGIAVLLVGGMTTGLWQGLVGAALALLCFAAAEGLERVRTRDAPIDRS